jgi:MtrB/PioB family decaheme-associated outer membrane protein
MVNALLALLFVPAVALSQDSGTPKQNFIEFGFRWITGTVERRTNPGEIPFSNGFRPDILNSGINIYRDYRNGFYVPRANVFVDNALGSKSYFSLQTVSNGIAFSGRTMPRDQSLLATVGRYGLYKLQFRWDQTPHITSGTTRSLFNQTSPGVWKFSGNRAALEAARVLGTGVALFNAVTPQAANAVLDVQRGIRKTGSGLASWDIKPDWNVAFLFSRENQVGTRPHNMCFGNSPSCYTAEIPENIDYFTNTLKIATEFVQKNWGMQLGYWRQSFENNVTNMLVDNPFSNNTNSTTVTANGNLSLYPDNKAHNLLFAGALNLGGFHFMTSISPGWNSQDDPFVAYTTNEFLLNRTGAVAPIPLPVPSLNGERRTLAMNYTVVGNPFKNLELAARYRHYDNKDKVEEHVFNPYVNDIAAEAQLAGPSGQEVKEFIGVGGVTDPHCLGVCNVPYTFHTKDLELSGTWFFSKKSLAKVQYGRQWFDRENRDVSQTIEDTFKVSADLKPTRDLTFRIAGAIQDRKPQDSHYEWFLVPGTQRPDEGFRRRYRTDLLARYDLTDRLSISGFYRTVQDDLNRRNRLTSLTPLGDLSLVSVTTVRPTPMYGPYYVYGVLKDLGWNWGGDFDFMVNEDMSLFGEYTRERNVNRQVSRQRSKNTASQVGCPAPPTSDANAKADCDPINDWTTLTRDVVDTYTVGTDLSVHKKLNVSLYYSLAAAKGNMFSDGVNCQIGNGPNDSCRTSFPNWRLDTATNRAVTFSFPENVSRLHEVNAIVKFKASESISPKFEYRYQRFDYKDFQTSVMNPYSYVGSAIDPLGTTGLQRMIFLGADTPGYRAHVFTASLVYSF